MVHEAGNDSDGKSQGLGQTDPVREDVHRKNIQV